MEPVDGLEGKEERDQDVPANSPPGEFSRPTHPPIRSRIQLFVGLLIGRKEGPASEFAREPRILKIRIFQDAPQETRFKPKSEVRMNEPKLWPQSTYQAQHSQPSIGWR